MTQMMLKITVNILTLPAVICLGLEISVDQGEVEAKVKIYSCVLCRSAQKKYTIYCITIRNFILLLFVVDESSSPTPKTFVGVFGAQSLDLKIF